MMPVASLRGWNRFTLTSFFTDFPVGRFHEAISSRLPWRSEDHFCVTSPLDQRLADEIWLVCHERRSWHTPLQRRHFELLSET